MTTDGKYLASIYTEFDSNGNAQAWTPNWNKPRCKPEVAEQIMIIIKESLNTAPLEARLKEHTRHAAFLWDLGYLTPGDPSNASISFGVHRKTIYSYGGEGFEDVKKLAIDRLFKFMES